MFKKIEKFDFWCFPFLFLVELYISFDSILPGYIGCSGKSYRCSWNNSIYGLNQKHWCGCESISWFESSSKKVSKYTICRYVLIFYEKFVHSSVKVFRNPGVASFLKSIAYHCKNVRETFLLATKIAQKKHLSYRKNYLHVKELQHWSMAKTNWG